MSETYKIEGLRDLAADQQEQEFEAKKKKAIETLHKIHPADAEILGEAMGIMEYQMNEAKQHAASLGRIANNMQRDLHEEQRHAMILGMFMRDVKAVNNAAIIHIRQELRKVVKEYDEYVDKRKDEKMKGWDPLT